MFPWVYDMCPIVLTLSHRSVSCSTSHSRCHVHILEGVWEGEGCEENSAATDWWLPGQGAHRWLGAHRWPGSMKGWVGQDMLWKEQGPAGDVCFLREGFCSQTKTGIFKLLCMLGKKELCSVQLNTYGAQMLAGGPPAPPELCAISSGLYQVHGPRKSRPLAKTAPCSQGAEAVRAMSSCKVLPKWADSRGMSWERGRTGLSDPALKSRRSETASPHSCR